MQKKNQKMEKAAIDLVNIEDDEEFELASEAFFQLFVEEEE